MTIANKHAISPVTAGWGNFETMLSVVDLTRCLLDDWPETSDSPAYLTALMVCQAVLAGGEDDVPEHARASFVEAAHEAGLFVSPDDDADLPYD